MAAYQVPVNGTAIPLTFLMVLASDHLTGATGLSPTVTIRKVGGAFGSPAGAVSEVGNGWYEVAGNATDENTLGPLMLHATAGTADVVDREFEVVAFNPQDAVRLGLTAIPNAVAGANGGSPVLSVSATTLAYTISTLTTYTGNTVQTGDAYAQTNSGTFGLAVIKGYVDDIGVAGAGLTALGDTRLANLDATVSSRGTSTLTQTQVTGGAYAINNASFAFASGLDFTTTQKAATLARVTLTDTVTTYTGDTPQTGDSFARLGVAGAGLTNIGDTRMANLDATVSSRMATYTQPTGFLAASFPGTVASSTEVTAIQNNTRTVIVVPEVIERPDSGTDTYLIHIYLYDETGNMEAPDSAPAVSLVNAAGTDRSSRLGSTTGTLVGTGHYKWVYTNTSTDTLEQLLWEFSVVEGGATRLFGRGTLLVDTTAVDFTSSDRTVLNAAATAIAVAAVKTDTAAILIDTAELQTDLTNGGRLDLLIDAILADTDSLDTTKITTARAGYLDNLSAGAVATATALATVSTAVVTTIPATLSTISTAVVTTIPARIPAALVSGRMDSSVGAVAAGAITDAGFTAPSEASGRPTTILAMIRRIWERTANKRTRDRATGTVLLRNAADDGTLETQTQSTVGTTDTETKGV